MRMCPALAALTLPICLMSRTFGGLVGSPVLTFSLDFTEQMRCASPPQTLGYIAQRKYAGDLGVSVAHQQPADAWRNFAA